MDLESITKSELWVTSQISIPGFPDVFVVRDQKSKEVNRIIQSTNFFIKILHIVMSNTWLPYGYKVVDKAKNLFGKIEKKWQPFSDRIFVFNEKGLEIGYLKPDIGLRKTNYTVYSVKDEILATINGNSKDGMYTLTSKKSKSPGQIIVDKQNILVKLFVPQMRYRIQLPEISGTDAEKRVIILTMLLLPILTQEVNG